jgi:hypothetical protein
MYFLITEPVAMAVYGASSAAIRSEWSTALPNSARAAPEPAHRGLRSGT